MKKIFIDIDHESFVVHLNKDERIKDGDVYPIEKYDGSQGVDYGYKSDQDGSHLDTKEGARCLFGFLFSWRGVWDGRIYFKDEEYFSRELVTIKRAWDEIEKLMKARIKEQYPDHVYDD